MSTFSFPTSALRSTASLEDVNEVQKSAPLERADSLALLAAVARLQISATAELDTSSEAQKSAPLEHADYLAVLSAVSRLQISATAELDTSPKAQKSAPLERADSLPLLAAFSRLQISETAGLSQADASSTQASKMPRGTKRKAAFEDTEEPRAKRPKVTRARVERARAPPAPLRLRGTRQRWENSFYPPTDFVKSTDITRTRARA